MLTPQKTLIQFEQDRYKNSYVPPEGSNSYYRVGDGKINLLTKRSDPDNYRFDLYTDSGHIYTGAGTFEVSGDIIDCKHPYDNLFVINGTELSVTRILSISSGSADIHGTLDLMDHARLVLSNNANVIMYADSKLVINEDSQIVIQEGSHLTIYGEIEVELSRVDQVMNVRGITIDSAAVLTVTGLDTLGERSFSVTDYEMYLRDKEINVQTQGEFNFPTGRLGYSWINGSPITKSKVLQMRLLYGHCPLGDFRLPILGIPNETVPEMQMLSELYVSSNSTLYITEKYSDDDEYVRPELYLGIMIGNNKHPGSCRIDGTVIVDGNNAQISLDRGGNVVISKYGTLILKNGAKLVSTYNDTNRVLTIDGTLIIDDINQINTLNADNIDIGPEGRVEILNPDTGESKVLLSIPNGIEDSDLYRLFKHRIDHVVYHISNHTGISIDKYCEYYATDLVKWYGDRRIEKAIQDGIIKWHDGGFIQLDHQIIPWANVNCTLLDVGKLFKTYGSTPEEQLQDAVNRLKYAGCGNMVFRFVDGDNHSEVQLDLGGIDMVSIINHPLTESYQLRSDGDGELYLKNNVSSNTPDAIVTDDSKVVDIEDGIADFELP